jgi:hypothetical protein
MLRGGLFSRYFLTAMSDSHWQKRAKGILKAELKRRHVGYKELH